MMKSRRTYLLLGLIVVLSVAAAMVPRVGDAARAVAALPAAAAAIGLVVQLLRDQMAHDRAVGMQATQHSFSVGAASHMAGVAFDKHVAFSEEYAAEVFCTLRTLFREGPTEQALPHAARLYAIRQKWALWLTPSMEAKLEKFEAAIRKIGADAHFVEVDQAHPERSRTIQEMFELFKGVMGKTITETPMDADHAISSVIQDLRRVLGTEELTDLRRTLVSQALKNAGSQETSRRRD